LTSDPGRVCVDGLTHQDFIADGYNGCIYHDLEYLVLSLQEGAKKLLSLAK
jgi:hypothetical protein